MPVLGFTDEVCESNKEEMIWISGDCYREWCGWLSLCLPAPDLSFSALAHFHQCLANIK